ncbi:class I SAM-dependent methyltransferase [Burkholderia cenocepacia]|uniref:class I SAM-dependent methyltransferase n=1 Tax=Burkholderia cenocepacia TaxID=95486 RepID=UPI002AB68C8D|nr:hypothetical protein [Burkholderia cenocepacia]
MKAEIRKAVRVVADLPVVGRLVRIVVAAIRLPEFRADVMRRQEVYEKDQLPMLLRTLSELNDRQRLLDNDQDNLVRSVPVALRRLHNDVKQLKSLIEEGEVFGRENQQKLDERVGEQLSQAMTLVGQVNDRLNGMDDSVRYLLGRVEFVRRELMFEMRYGASSPGEHDDTLKAKTEIIAKEKVAAAAGNGELRLNLGCGHIALDGYLNVDRRALPGVDIVSEVDELPFKSGELSEIFSAHLLEHFPQEQMVRELLPYWFDLLKPGGEFHAVVPDAQAMMKNYIDGDYPYAYLREVTFGGQDYDGDFHFNMFTPESMSAILTEAGFVDISLVEAGRRNGNCYEFEIVAKRAAKA